jgi:hypothetical protein
MDEKVARMISIVVENVCDALRVNDQVLFAVDGTPESPEALAVALNEGPHWARVKLSQSQLLALGSREAENLSIGLFTTLRQGAAPLEPRFKWPIEFFGAVPDEGGR